MTRERAFIQAEVVLLTKDEGGRSTPVLPVAYDGGLRPHIVLQDRFVRAPKVGMRDGHQCVVDDYLSVAFWSGPSRVPIGRPFELMLLLWCHPDPMYDECVPGATFTIREGGKIIGHGQITRRWVEPPNEIAMSAPP